MSGVSSKADLAAESVLLFPLTPIWLGIQHLIISLLFDIESRIDSISNNKEIIICSLIIRGFSSFLLLNDSKIERVGEYHKFCMFTFRNDVESKVYCTSFRC